MQDIIGEKGMDYEEKGVLKGEKGVIQIIKYCINYKNQNFGMIFHVHVKI